MSHERRASSTVAVPQLRDSWDKKLKMRADRAAVLAAQKAADDEIRQEKRVCAKGHLLRQRALH